jgi:SAM-dependent methyltransferase
MLRSLTKLGPTIDNIFKRELRVWRKFDSPDWKPGAEKLPFADASFDLVTCQTVLVHTRDPGAAVDEMVRVTRPGGLIPAAEPNNVVRALMFDSVSFHETVDEILARARLQLICERGKAALGMATIQSGTSSPQPLR